MPEPPERSPARGRGPGGERAASPPAAAALTASGTIDGIPVTVRRGTTLLSAARELGIDIPTLCHHEGLPPEGSCRLCLCEVKGQLAVSCMYPLAADGFAALTGSPAVMEARRHVIWLLAARAPKAPRIARLAEEYGARPDPRFMKDPDGCIRCGRCVRACRASGPEAIALCGRGYGRFVTGPFGRPPEDCIGCLACALSCPVGKIAFSERPDRRRIWERDFELAPCPECGARVFTREQLAFHGAAASALCPSCRRRAMAGELRKAAAFEAAPALARSL